MQEGNALKDLDLGIDAETSRSPNGFVPCEGWPLVLSVAILLYK